MSRLKGLRNQRNMSRELFQLMKEYKPIQVIHKTQMKIPQEPKLYKGAQISPT
jgi:hypothetical protein